MRKRNIYIAIMAAAEKGQGLRLSADEVGQLAFDDAIETHASNCLDEKDWPKIGSDRKRPGWGGINPYRKRAAANLTNL